MWKFTVHFFHKLLIHNLQIKNCSKTTGLQRQFYCENSLLEHKNKKNLSIKPKGKMLDILLSDLVIIVSFNHAIWEPFPFDAFGVRSQSFSSHIILQNFTAVMRMPIRLAGDRSSAPESLLSATIVLRRRSSSSQFSNGDRVKKIWSVYVKNSPVKKALFR